MSEQVNEQVVDHEAFEEAVTPDVIEAPETLPQKTPIIVMPTKASVGQRIVDTAVTMVASTVVVGATNIVVQGVSKGATMVGKKIKGLYEHHKERKLNKKAEREAAKLKKAAEAQEVAEEAAPSEAE